MILLVGYEIAAGCCIGIEPAANERLPLDSFALNADFTKMCVTLLFQACLNLAVILGSIILTSKCALN
jgi:hypothetical protein